MRLFRIGLVIALIGTLALFAIPIRVAKADTCLSYDFRTGTHGWVGNYTTSFTDWNGVQVDGQGWTATHHTDGGDGWAATPKLPLGGTFTITSVEFTGYDADSSPSSDTNSAFLTDSGGSNVASFTPGWVGGEFDLTWSVGAASSANLVISVATVAGGSAALVRTVTVCGSDLPTPTPTPSPTPVGGMPATANDDPCPLLGDSNANMTDTSRWIFNDASNGPGGVDITNGFIEQLISLSRYNKYVVTLKFKQSVADSTTAIDFRLGETNPIEIPFTATTDEQTFKSDPANYEPTTLGASDNYDFAISILSINTGNTVILTYACVSDASNNATNSLGASGADATALTSLCQSCTYDPGTINGLGDIINNIVKLLQWLWCGFSQIWDCSVRPFFATLLAVIGVIIAAIAFIRQWAAVILSNGNGWIGALIPILWHFISGFIINLIQAVLNAAATLARSLGLGALFDFIVSLIQNGPVILGLISSWVQQAIAQILNVLSAIPTLFNAIVSGFNQSATSTGATAPVCNDTSSMLYAPCLGLYVLDNTIFAGPMFYAIPLALGLVAFNTVLWAMQEIRGALTK